MKKLITSCTLLLLCCAVAAQNDNAARAKALVSKMTLEEKVSLLVGRGMKLPGMSDTGNAGNGTGIGQTMDKVEGAAGTTNGIDRLGIPLTVVADGPAGLRIEPVRKDNLRTYYATAWPVATLLASTWDINLVRQVGEAMGNEVKEYGVDVLLGPGLNIHRNPLGGRNFEYYSEDPLVSGKMTAAMVNGIQSNGVGTSIKHFALNNQETNRNTVNSIVGERAMREIYLKGFQIAVKESNPWTVMSSYNKLNGTYTSESYDLLTTILRKEWGFKGLVMTDWFGGKDAVAQMKAGNDLLMPGTPQQTQTILDAVKTGKLDVKIIDENAARMVAYALQTPAAANYAFSNKPSLVAHAAVARAAAAAGMVLLKNEAAALPLGKQIKSIAAFGNTAYDFISGGTGSGDVNEAYTISLVQGLTNAGYRLDEALKKSYTTYLDEEKRKHPKKNFFEEFMNPTPRAAEMNIAAELFVQKAKESDIGLITIGRNAGEGSDRKVENDFNLSESEIALINNVSNAFHAAGKKVLVVLNVGGVVEMVSWRDKVDAILLAWQPGMEAGNAVADVLSGAVNPSGKLVTTFPVRYADVPSAASFPGKEFPDQATVGMFGMKSTPAEVIYEEGIYVGYRYYNTFGVKPAYEFGYGLSYSNFTFSNLKLSSTSFKDKITVSVDVANSGSVAGKEVVQLYLKAPSAKLNKPEAELKAFDKTKLLKPGEKQTISFMLKVDALSSFETASTSWIAEAGKYEVRVGNSALAVNQRASFDLSKGITVEKCNKVLVPQVAIKELVK
jgi:beta-glucosidase